MIHLINLQITYFCEKFRVLNNLNSDISDNGFSISPVDGLYAGSYYLYIIDENGCFSEMIYNIEEPDELVVSWNNSDLDTLIECYGENNGSLGIIIEGGVPIDDDTWPFPYYYTTWINTETSSSFSNLYLAATYSI